MVIRNKNKKTRIRLAIVIAIAIVGSGILLATRFNSHPAPAERVAVQDKGSTTNAIKVENDRYSIPMRLVIPKINVDTSIEQMGLTESGDMEAPRTDEESGWYKHGPNPGNVGSAVIAGHLGVNNRAVFSQLNLLVKGDTITVIDDRGQTVSFVVTGTREYDNDASPSEVFTSTAGSHLNLITCEGSWDASQDTYAQRLVVFADRIDEN